MIGRLSADTRPDIVRRHTQHCAIKSSENLPIPGRASVGCRPICHRCATDGVDIGRTSGENNSALFSTDMSPMPPPMPHRYPMSGRISAGYRPIVVDFSIGSSSVTNRSQMGLGYYSQTVFVSHIKDILSCNFCVSTVSVV